MVEHLLGTEANPCQLDHQGYGALHYAALNGHKLTLEMVSSGLCQHVGGGRGPNDFLTHFGFAKLNKFQISKMKLDRAHWVSLSTITRDMSLVIFILTCHFSIHCQP